METTLCHWTIWWLPFEPNNNYHHLPQMSIIKIVDHLIHRHKERMTINLLKAKWFPHLFSMNCLFILIYLPNFSDSHFLFSIWIFWFDLKHKDVFFFLQFALKWHFLISNSEFIFTAATLYNSKSFVWTII